MYLYLLGRALERSTWSCLGYAVMSNHIHLVMVASDEPLAHWIRTPHARFADWMNRTNKRIGNVFTRGPKDILIPDSRVGHVLAYVHNNPVRAKLATEPEQSSWTSHRFYTGREPAPSWLKVHEGFARSDTNARSQATFDAFVRRTTAHPVLGDVESDEDFMLKLEDYERQQSALVERMRPPRILPELIATVAAAEATMPLVQLRSTRRGVAETRARAAVVRCGTRLGMTTAELVSALHITRQAVSKILRSESSADVDELAQRIAARLAHGAGAVTVAPALDVIHTS